MLSISRTPCISSKGRVENVQASLCSRLKHLYVVLHLPKKKEGSMFTFQSRAQRGDEADYAELYDLVVLKDVSVEQGSIIPRFNQLSKVFGSCSLKISKN